MILMKEVNCSTEIQIEILINFLKKTGTLILFPANTYHAVKKITKGTRFSLATWFFNKHKTLI